jgi:hypothetical protein
LIIRVSRIHIQNFYKSIKTQQIGNKANDTSV